MECNTATLRTQEGREERSLKRDRAKRRRGGGAVVFLYIFIKQGSLCCHLTIPITMEWSPESEVPVYLQSCYC